jgi:hypothetical protein
MEGYISLGVPGLYGTGSISSLKIAVMHKHKGFQLSKKCVTNLEDAVSGSLGLV